MMIKQKSQDQKKELTGLKKEQKELITKEK